MAELYPPDGGSGSVAVNFFLMAQLSFSLTAMTWKSLLEVHYPAISLAAIVLQWARQRKHTAEFKERYKKRAGGNTVLFSRIAFFLAPLLICLSGCASTVHTLPQAQISDSPAVAEQSRPIPQVSSSGAVLAQDGRERADLERLTLLWQSRTQEGTVLNFPIGPGDVLEISVPAMEELTSRVVRVSDDGTISLPFVGVVQTGGLTETGLREEIQRRLEKDYMYDPQVNLFVREYRSRQVAVVGAVDKPGLYSLASGTDSLLDMISLAGGLTDKAAPRILFIPAESGAHGKANELAFTQPVQPVSTPSASLTSKSTDPIVIDLQSLTKGGNQISLTLPARPGDVIMVPGSGEVLVGGWVKTPGSYRITPGLTVLGAVDAAGGPLFPANTSAVQVIRTGKGGEQTFLVADLEKIKRGESPDIPVQESDVVEVASSTAKLVPYGLYDFLSKSLGFGFRLTP